MKMIQISVFLISLVVSTVSLAETTVLLTPSDKKGVTTNYDFKAIKALPYVLEVKSAFTPKEQGWLRNWKASSLSQAQIVTLKSAKNIEQLKTYIRRLVLPFYVDEHQIETKTAANPDEFGHLQWQFKNKNQCQSIELDHSSYKQIPGVAGEDINMGQIAKTGKDVIVAVLDTGVDKDHPDLKGRLVRKESECKALAKFEQCLVEDNPDVCKLSQACIDDPVNCTGGDDNSCRKKMRRHCEKIWFDVNHPEVDKDGNGYPLDCTGWSVFSVNRNEAGIIGFPDFDDERGHGTHVAGLIAANANNGIGVKGCSPNVKVLPVQVLGKAPNEPIKPLSVDLSPVEPLGGKRRPTRVLGDWVARGLMYALHSGAKVANFSLGWPQEKDSEFMRQVFDVATKQGMILVASAGNDSTKALLRPCAYPGVLCVASHGPDGAISHFSNYGMGVDIAAPGLNVLSTWPMELRPRRFRSDYGYERLHGTSQASPLVACMVAEMMSQGVPSKEIYPRLLVGSRPSKQPLKIVEGLPHEVSCDATPKLPRDVLYEKFTLAGNADFQRSMSVQPQPLILPAEKAMQIIKWDRNEKNLNWEFSLKNYWKTTGKKVTIQANIVRAHAKSIRPLLLNITPVGSHAGHFKGPENDPDYERKFNAQLQLVDSEDPANSRIPSELFINISVYLDGVRHRSFQIGAEIIVPVSPRVKDPKFTRLKIEGKPEGRTSQLPVFHIYDNKPQYMDYILFGNEPDPEDPRKSLTWTFYLRSQGLNSNSATAPYKLKGPVTVEAPEVKGALRLGLEQVKQAVADGTYKGPPSILDDFFRVDTDFDGKSEYVLSFLDNRYNLDPPEASPVYFYVFDQNFKLKDQWSFDSQLSQYPANTSNQVQWMKLGNKKVPAWLGFGKDPDFKHNARDIWKLRTVLSVQDPEDIRAVADDQLNNQEIRFYFIKGDNQVGIVEPHKHKATPESEEEEYIIVDTLSPNASQMDQGRIPVLLAKARGTEIKSSYIIDFAVAEVSEGKIENFTTISPFQQGLAYRNLLDTRVDSAFNLDNSKALYSGTFWFGSETLKDTRVSVLMEDTKQFFDHTLSALRGDVDSALWARYAYTSAQGPSIFVLTNSEIQYHDMAVNQAVNTSLRRYTFYDDFYTSNLNFPFIVGNSRAQGPDFLPTLFTTEGSGFNRGIRFLVPQYSSSGELLELSAPATLRFQSQRGCRPMDAPFWAGPGKPTFLDYYCGKEYIRIPLEY